MKKSTQVLAYILAFFTGSILGSAAVPPQYPNIEIILAPLTSIIAVIVTYYIIKKEKQK